MWIPESPYAFRDGDLLPVATRTPGASGYCQWPQALELEGDPGRRASPRRHGYPPGDSDSEARAVAVHTVTAGPSHGGFPHWHWQAGLRLAACQ